MKYIYSILFCTMTFACDPSSLDIEEATNVDSTDHTQGGTLRSEEDSMNRSSSMDQSHSSAPESDMTLPAELDQALPDTPPFTPNKSYKRGIAHGFQSEADFTVISSGISWWYNWSPSYNPEVAHLYEDQDMDWVPMSWNGNNPDEVRAFLDEHPTVKYLLTFNEPNFQDQANLTPEQVASLWPTLAT